MDDDEGIGLRRGRRRRRSLLPACDRRLSFASQLLALALAVLLVMHESQAATTKHVLVLYENNRLLPANIEADHGLSQAVQSSGRNVELSAEFLDYPRFAGDAFFQVVTAYLRGKYATHPPDVIVAGGDKALDFLLRNRSQL